MEADENLALTSNISFLQLSCLSCSRYKQSFNFTVVFFTSNEVFLINRGTYDL